jgi:hypothetical protein
MSLPIPNQITPLQSASTQDMPVHLYERVSAQVVRVAGSQAVLEINGYPIVARLTSREQAAELFQRKTADFVITHLSRDELTLKLITHAESAESLSVQAQIRDPSLELSGMLGLRGAPAELDLIRAALQEKIPISGELVGQLLEAVEQSGLDIAKGIELAVKLKAAGLPVTADSLKIAGRFQDVHLAAPFSTLIQELRGLLTRLPDNDPLAAEIRTILSHLESMIPRLAASEDNLKTALQELFRFLGKPYEKLLAEQLAGGDVSGDDTFSLLNLLHLGKNLRESGQLRLADTIDRFLEQVRQSQLLNIKPDAPQAKGLWSEVNFVVQWRNANEQPAHDARVRISYRQDKKLKAIDPNFTNLYLQVDLEPHKDVVISLAICQHKVISEISSTDFGLLQLYGQSLPEFEDLLSGLGYQVIRSSVHFNADARNSTDESTSWADLQDARVNIVV